MVESVFREDWSPEQVVGWFARFTILAISHKTIYRYIWLDQKRGGNLHLHLRRANKPFRKRYGAYDTRGRLAQLNKRHISTRPFGAEHRSRYGHWEGDTVLGHSQAGACIVTRGPEVGLDTGSMYERRADDRESAPTRRRD